MKRCVSIPSLFLSLTFAAGAAGFSACSGPDETPGAGTDNPPGTLNEPLDYHRDAKALLGRYCTDCHRDGGIAPFALTDYASAKAQASQIQAAVLTGNMPPWMPSDNGMPLQHTRNMRPEDKEMLLRWISQGAPEGDPQAAPRVVLPPADKVEPPRADLVADMGVTYNPNTKLTDDYRCFIIDPKLTADRYLRASDVRPGNPRIVHHVIAYEILEADVAAIRAKDPDGKGYTCFGAPGTSGPPTTLLGWAPGSPGSRMPEGTALRLHKGSLIVVQVHYNVLYGPGQSDRTVMSFELTDTPPARELYALPLARPKMLKIPAGMPDAVQTIEVPLSALTSFFKLPSNSLTVYAHTPHMHLLGRRITTWLNGQLVLDLPRWDYHWQQAYLFQEPYQAKGTDVLKLECRYDNTAANQPVINGQQQAPRDVTWGEGTLDEMCLNYVLLSAQ